MTCAVSGVPVYAASPKDDGFEPVPTSDAEDVGRLLDDVDA